MAEIIITPEGRDAIETGLMVDDDGDRFVVVSYLEPGKDRVVVTFTAALFDDYVAHLQRVADHAKVDANWRG